MKVKLILSIVAISMISLACSSDKPQTTSTSLDLNNYYDSLSYSLGFDIGHSFLAQLIQDSMKINMDLVLQGLKDGILPNEDSAKRLIPQTAITEVLQAMQQRIQEKQQKEFEEKQKKYEERKKTSKEDGEKFLEENKKKEGVVVEKSGLQHRSIKTGNGSTPKETDIIKFHIVAKFIDGEEFQSTRSMDAPEVPLSQLQMPAMKEAISKMKVGDMWEIVCPPKLAYGDQETGIVPPNSVVIFEIELLNIVQPPPDTNK